VKRLDLSNIKQKLLNNQELIIKLLEELGCHSISIKNNQIRSALPDGDSPTNIRIKLNDNLTTTVFSRGDFEGGDIVNLVEYLKQYKFTKALRWICNVLNIPYDFKFEQKNKCEAISVIKAFKDKQYTNGINYKEINVELLDMFIRVPHTRFLNDGIAYNTQIKHNICYDVAEHRIIIPIYNKNGSLINFKGRYDGTEEEIKNNKIPKYLYYYEYNGDILYGLDKNCLDIILQNEVVVFESEKSVLQADSFGFYNTVAIGCHDITPQQTKDILELKCNVILAFDKDVELKHIHEQCKKFSRFTNVFYIYDYNDWLKNKESPTDKGLSIWNQLYKNKIKFCI
jgi:DNA primase